VPVLLAQSASHLCGPGSVLGPGKWFGSVWLGLTGMQRSNSQAPTEDLSESERFRAVD